MRTLRVFGVVVLIVASFYSNAQTFNTNGNWNTAGNWSPAAVPSGTGTNVTLGADPTVTAGNNDIIGNVTVNNNVTLTVNANGKLTLGSSALFGAGTKKSMTFSNNGTIQINSGSPDGVLEIWGDLIVSNNLTLQVTGSLIVHGNVTMNNNATVQVTGGGTISVGGNFTGGNNAILQVSGSGSTINVTGSISLGNNGTISTSAGGTISSSGCSCSGCSAQCGSVMPVTLIDFYPSLGNNSIILKWATAAELNFNYFDLQKSNDGSAFKSIAEIKGHGTTNERHDYDFEDNFPVIGKNYYRLTSIDFDNYRETFKVIEQDYSGEKDFQVSPNPSDGRTIALNFNFDSMRGQVVIYDNLGSVVDTFNIDEASEVSFTTPLKNGIYFAKYSSSSFTKAIRFLVRQ